MRKSGYLEPVKRYHKRFKPIANAGWIAKVMNEMTIQNNINLDLSGKSGSTTYRRHDAVDPSLEATTPFIGARGL
jgi:hypothetical protein